jgi:serine/threonine protein kinase
MSPDPAVPMPEMTRLPAAEGESSTSIPPGFDTGIPRIEGYQVLEKLGQGGMGTVWHAVQLGTRRKVALKLMSAAMFASDRARARFDREVELTARLDHPNIAAVFDSGLDRGVYFYAMERVDGVPLDLYVESHKMPRREILELMRTICRAVHHAHQRGVIHRDLKPSNILVSADGEPHVLDFGLAKTVLHEDAGVSISGDDNFAGTPAYMSPEQAAGHVGKLDVRTDVYTLGVIAYRLLLNQSPHDLSGSQLEIMRRISDTDAKPPRTIDKTIGKDLEAILLKALSRQQNDRYASAGELAQDLDNYLNRQPLLAHPPTVGYLLKKWTRRYIWPVSIAALVLVVLISIAIYSDVNVRAARDLAEQQSEQKEYLIRFNNDLARQPTVDAMLQLAVDRAMARSGADAGSLFVRDGDVLRFEIARNKTLESRLGRSNAAANFTRFTLPISDRSIAGYVAHTGRMLNLADAYNLPVGATYKFNSDFDKMNAYRTQSILAVPLIADSNGESLGVLELINCTANGAVVPFPANQEHMIQAMAEQAAVVLRLRKR